jgi:hypothetical protein
MKSKKDNTENRPCCTVLAKDFPDYRFDLELEVIKMDRSPLYLIHLICIPENKKKEIVVFPNFFMIIKLHDGKWMRFLPSQYRNCAENIGFGFEAEFVGECGVNLRHALNSDYDTMGEKYKEYYSMRLVYSKKPTLKQIKLSIKNSKRRNQKCGKIIKSL